MGSYRRGSRPCAGLLLLCLVLLACCTGLSACSGGGSSTTSSGLSAGAGASAAVQQLNNYRAIGSLMPVQNDVQLSAGAQLHASYLNINSVSLAQVGLNAHVEQPGMPGYSEAGAAAGLRSVIYEGVTAVQAVDNWICTLYHRLGLFDPNLTRVGFGSMGEYQVMDVGHGRALGFEAQDGFTLFPFPGMQAVPGSYIREIPHPVPGDLSLGMPITVEFFGFRGLEIDSVTAQVSAADTGGFFPVYVSYPGKPFLPGWDLGQLISVIPQDPLPPATPIQVRITAQVDGRPFMQQWQFVTR